jgi:predicted ABC-type transport system involved in lysophospholipase L1 biosynthesis ATPase subunit
MTSDLLIVASGLKKSFKIGDRTIHVLRGVEIGVKKGEVVFLVGASGAGKTTLLHTLAGLESPDEGVIEFGGTDVYELGDAQRARLRNRRMGFVFQSYHLLPELTALENVLLPRRITGVVDEALGKSALDRVGLDGRLNHLPGELSGGEQQRVAIARALINDPEVIFADEPTGNLDSETGAQVVDLLLSIAKAEGKTLMVVTHDQSLSGKGDRKVKMQDGRIVAG